MPVTGMLASVRDVAEARVVLAAGVDLIDLKKTEGERKSRVEADKKDASIEDAEEKFDRAVKREISRIWARENDAVAEVMPSSASLVAAHRMHESADKGADDPPEPPAAGQAALHELPSVWNRRPAAVETVANGPGEPPAHVSGVSDRR